MCLSHSPIECRTCGWTEAHDPKCPKHECSECGARGEHHCTDLCDVLSCQLCGDVNQESEDM